MPNKHTLTQETLKNVKKIEWSTKKIIDSLVSGQFKSHFKGQGVQFSEHRLYQSGDDVRHIDWKSSARNKDLLLKKFEEERQLTVFLIIDVSQSQHFGSHSHLKLTKCIELAGLLGLVAAHTGDKVGGMLLTDKPEYLLKPQTGKIHVLRFLRDIFQFSPASKKTDLKKAFEVTSQLLSHKSIIFILSDFLSPDYTVSLKKLAKKHEVISFVFEDPLENTLPPLGILQIHDPETEKESWIDTRSTAFQESFLEEKKRFIEKREKLFRLSGIRSLTISPDEHLQNKVIRFFLERKMRKK